MRRCVVCRGSFPKSNLLRLTRAEDGTYSLSPNRGGAGRGTYLCSACAADADEKRLRKAFRASAGHVSALLAQLQALTDPTHASTTEDARPGDRHVAMDRDRHVAVHGAGRTTEQDAQHDGEPAGKQDGERDRERDREHDGKQDAEQDGGMNVR